MKTVTTFLFCLAMTLITCGQTEQLNQLNASGKKDGKWTVYLDKDWKKIKDSSTAVYLRYTYYHNGENIYPMGQCGGKDYKLEGTAKAKLLDGEYKWYDTKGHLSSIHIFKDGEYVSCKEYYSTGVLKHHFDYTKKCEGQPHSWTIYIYDKKGNLTLTFPVCEKNGSWPATRG